VAVVDSGPQVSLRNWFERPYDGAISAARTCYSPRVVDPDEITPGQRERIGPLTFEGGHHTVFQHATFEFALSGISRQLVWCFLHAFPYYNTEQQSQRYVRLEEVAAVVPPALRGEARSLYEAAIERAWSAYRELARRLETRTRSILAELWRLDRRQSKAFGRSVAREAEKKAIETARYVIPIACHTAMVYTVSGLVLHRLRRMVNDCDVPREAADVVGRMVACVEQIDPDFFGRIGDPPLSGEELPETRFAPPGLGEPAALEAFDKSLDGCRSRLVNHGVRSPAVVAAAVRHVLGRFDLDDESALAMALDPARNRLWLETLNVSTHSPLMRTLAHAHYTFRKKLSHTADSQDQRHRTVPGSRPLLSRTVPDRVDVAEPGLVAEDPGCRGGMGCAAPPARRRGRPGARSLRATERTRRALRGVRLAPRSPAQVEHADLPQRPARDLRGLDGGDRAGARRPSRAGASRRTALLRAKRARAATLHRGNPLLRGAGVAQLPRRLAPHLNALGSALALLLWPAAASAGVDLDGTWHVLIHYRDAATANPDVVRWEDRVWEFSPKGSRLEWAEFPIVVFDDESGRFERRKGTGQYARVLHAWEPSPEQLQNLRAGLAVNDRGSQRKSLRRSGGGWRSGARASPSSASVITYEETWSIEDPQGLPVFEQVEVLGSESAVGLEGTTLLRTAEVREDGALLVGSFDRDGTRIGSFQMRRAGSRRPLEKRTQSQLQGRAAARAAVDDSEFGGVPRGRSPSRAVFTFAPEGARHDDATRYRLPFDPSVPRRLRAGIGADLAMTVLGPTSDWTGHKGWSRYSFDFELPRNAEVRAARGGRVASIGDGFIERDDQGGRTSPELLNVVVLHPDGTFAVYGHLAAVDVELEQVVAVGERIGAAAGPFVHFGVARNEKAGAPESLPIRFDDGSAEGMVPVAGLSYGGRQP